MSYDLLEAKDFLEKCREYQNLTKIICDSYEGYNERCRAKEPGIKYVFNCHQEWKEGHMTDDSLAMFTISKNNGFVMCIYSNPGGQRGDEWIAEMEQVEDYEKVTDVNSSPTTMMDTE
jgi:hypothetical protein